MKRYIRMIVTIVLSVLFFMPFYIAIINMFKPLKEIKSNPLSLPFPFVWDNFIHVLTKPGNVLYSSLWNSTVITSISVFFIVISASMVSYYIARENSKFSNGLMIYLLFGLMIPPQIVLIPIVKVLQFFGVMHSMTGVIIFFIAYYVPFAAFLYSGFTKTIPKELDEAAAIDGAGQVRTFWTIIFPLLAPVTASVLIFQSVFIWNDFLNPLIIMGPMKGTTVTTGIYQAMGQFSTNWGEMFVLMFVASAPILVFYLFLQKHFIEGLTAGSIKG